LTPFTTASSSFPLQTVRIGLVGLGNKGRAHRASIRAGKVEGLTLTAICDRAESLPDPVPGEAQFTDFDTMLQSGTIDAVLIATPHYFHTSMGIAALNAGLHVMVEKPLSVHKADCERLIAAHQGPQQVFGAMFQLRTDPIYQQIKSLITDGELGTIRRILWDCTDWFRTETYYASGGWRATWKGEGGGVLLNQCPHNLDLYQWLFGMPDQVTGFCQFGRYHDIEVDDDVTAYLEFANGATGVFITSTGEAPGTNRLEITAERGKLVYENDKIVFTRNETPMTEFSRKATSGFAAPATWDVSISTAGHGGQHNEILKNFTDAILDGTPLVSPAVEGIHSVELSNAMLLSAWTDETVNLPLDAKRYERLLRQKIATSKAKPKKKKVVAASDDFTKSFAR
jgi:hypothetical protein